MVRILVVENDFSNRDVLCRLLEDEGYPVQGVDNGQHALTLIISATDSLVVLLDYFMPTPGGFDIMTAVLANPVLCQRHAILLMSASPQTLPDDARTLIAQLNGRVLSKPFEIASLLQVVAEAAQRLASS
jgi:CheY-like chemotaxis protein